MGVIYKEGDKVVVDPPRTQYYYQYGGSGADWKGPMDFDAYKKAKVYLQSCSYREVATWLEATTGRKISAQGLRKKVLGDSEK